ncbi:MAG: YopT-type cysteine protease domain-containing protein [Caldilineaceae bacterium]
MNYDSILSRITGEGIQEYDQGEEALKEHIDIHNGVCRALVIEWLRAKKDNNDFWQGKGTVSEPLLAAVNKLKDAVDLQAEYSRVIESRFLPDPATMSELEKSGLKYDQDDVTASVQEGFAMELPNDEPRKIAEKVLSAVSRFFILSVKGSSGAHSIGIHRPYKLIGKSSDVYLFDPNIGEFKVSGEQNLRMLLQKINSIGYDNSGIDLNKSYILWSYSS